MVRAGLVSAKWGDILMPPVMANRQDQRLPVVRRRPPLGARVVTSDEYNELLVRQEEEEKEKEEARLWRQAEVLRKREMAQRKREEAQRKREEKERKRAEKERQMAVVEELGRHCAVCRSLSPPSGEEAGVEDAIYEWVQCELCELWFHLTCLGIASVPAGDWYCPKCFLSEI